MSKSKTLEVNIPRSAQLRSFLYKMELKYGVKTVIEMEEYFTRGLIFKTEMWRVFFHFEGERADEVLNITIRAIKEYEEK